MDSRLSGVERERLFRGIVVVEVVAQADPDTPDDELPADVAARVMDALDDLDLKSAHVYGRAIYPTVVQEFTELREVSA
jgi:hypothetical protein